MDVSARKEGSVGLPCPPHPLVGPPASVARLRLLPIDGVGIDLECEIPGKEEKRALVLSTGDWDHATEEVFDFTVDKAGRAFGSWSKE